MGTFPLIERPTPLYDLLKTRPTVLLDKPLIASMDGAGGTSKLGGKLRGKLSGKGLGLGLMNKLKSR